MNPQSPIPNPYADAILSHNRAPHRRGQLDAPTHCGHGDNALCGDSLRIELEVREGRIVDYAFEAEACAIVVATASMLGDALVDKDPEQLARIESDLRRLLGQQPPEPDAELMQRLGELSALAEMRALPRRHRCVTLALEALRKAFSSK